MKCPNCGTANGKTNKFCRECGTPLEGLAESSEQQEAQVHVPTVCALDDVALGEELFGVMRLYENNELDAAAERINRIIECSPGSASAHSIRALVYERRADLEAALGNTEVSHGYLQKAVVDYETIIDLNPDSVADREKLIGLRMKIAGNVISRPLARVSPTPAQVSPLDAVKTRLMKVPPPVLASGATLVVLLVLLSVLVPRGERANSQPAPDAGMQGGINVAATPAAPVQQPVQMNPTMGGYVYPTPPPAPMRSLVSSEEPRETSAPVPPVRLPSIGSELVIAPEPKKESEPAKSSQQEPAAEVRSGSIRITPSVPNDNDKEEATQPVVPDGTGLLAKAIDLSNQYRYAEAIQTAQQAVQLFQGDLEAGRNTTAAQRGLDNASKYIQLWRSSMQQ